MQRLRARPGSATRAVSLLLVALACALAEHAQADETSSAPAPPGLVALMAHFSNSGTVRADFRETRQLSLLADEIETNGVLYFEPPDRLARHTTRPGASRIIVDGAKVGFQDETGTRSLNLGASEVAQNLVGNLMVFLRGDLPELRERYAVEFSSDGQSWQVDLEPRSSAVRAIVERIRFSGVGWTVQAMETLETNGDTTRLAFLRVETQLSLSPDLSARIFSLDPTIP